MDDDLTQFSIDSMSQAIPSRTPQTQKALQLRQLAQALQTSSLQGPQQQVVGGRVVPIGLGSLLAQAVQGYAAKKYNEKASEIEGQATNEQNASLLRALQMYEAQRNGDPRAAAMTAITSAHPALQKAGLLDLQALSKKAADPKVPGHMDVARNDGLWQTYVIGSDGMPDMTKPIGDPFSKRPGASSTTINNSPEKKGREKLLEKNAEAISPGGKSFDAAQKSANGLATAQEALASINQGAKTGAGQPIIQGFRKIMSTLGFPDSATAPTDVLSAKMKESVITKLGGLGNQISDGDRNFVQGIHGDLTTDPNALRRLIAINAAADMKLLEQHQKLATQVGKETESPELAEANIPKWSFSFQNDPEMSMMVDNILTGRDSRAPADYAAVQPGQYYFAPDGSLRIKKGKKP